MDQNGVDLALEVTKGMIENLKRYNMQELQEIKDSDENLKNFINKHRMELQRLPMQRLRVLKSDDESYHMKLENIRTIAIRTYDDYYVEKEELPDETCETNPEELVIDAEAVSTLNIDWMNERKKVTVKDICFFYEFCVIMFRNATHLSLESCIPMQLEFVLKMVHNAVQLKLRGSTTTCTDTDLETLTARAANFESLEVNLDRLSTVTSAGIARMVQKIDCVDGARFDIRNFSEETYATYEMLSLSPLITKVSIEKDYCVYTRVDGKRIELHINGEEEESDE